MDYELEIKVRNGRIAQAMKRVGIESVAELVRRAGTGSRTIYKVINMKISPLDQYGEWRYEVLKMAEVLNCLPATLFNEHQICADMEENRIQVPMTADQLACFLGQSFGPTTAEEIEEMVDERLMLHRAMKHLSDRETQVLKLRLDNLMYDDVAKVMKITKERARCVEAKALEKVKKIVAQIRNGEPVCL
ncbi:MAG: hypothetical protein HQL87_10165 [Magnetococcales bacterium]|nr:hypothetical protein [Magnetococcales bacterium]